MLQKRRGRPPKAKGSEFDLRGQLARVKAPARLQPGTYSVDELLRKAGMDMTGIEVIDFGPYHAHLKARAKAEKTTVALLVKGMIQLHFTEGDK